ncbi:putative MAP kinase kinase kinase mkh1 [Blattamonas nauphoetae]|uniref:MAP kinase kinase kinase mkh1 n=1 Tax=Blattamonas nauphoetae TaxID=2049346 RepID=A0ABQ9XHR6_9EUKA|nr:putative MAP kinase kinase kinase mkh1 [Blattamonas nauphoetae]
MVNLDDGMIRAAKVVDDPRLSRKEYAMAEHLRKLEITLLLTFTNLQTKQMVFIVDYADQGNLGKLLENNHEPGMPEELVRRIIFMTAHGITQLHQHNFIHRDIKPDNLLLAFDPVTQSVRIMISGYSLLRQMDNLTSGETTLDMTFCGTPRYMPHEALDGDSYTQSIDIWALGCIAYELLEGRHPFQVKGILNLRQKVGEPPPPITTKQVSPAFLDFLNQTLSVDQNRRISAIDGRLLAHPWFEGLSESNCELAWMDFYFLKTGGKGALQPLQMHVSHTQQLPESLQDTMTDRPTDETQVRNIAFTHPPSFVHTAINTPQPLSSPITHTPPPPPPPPPDHQPPYTMNRSDHLLSHPSSQSDHTLQPSFYPPQPEPYWPPNQSILHHPTLQYGEGYSSHLPQTMLNQSPSDWSQNPPNALLNPYQPQTMNESLTDMKQSRQAFHQKNTYHNTVAHNVTSTPEKLPVADQQSLLSTDLPEQSEHSTVVQTHGQTKQEQAMADMNISGSLGENKSKLGAKRFGRERKTMEERMTCVYCGLAVPISQMEAHISEKHSEEISMHLEEQRRQEQEVRRKNHQYLETKVQCPFCVMQHTRRSFATHLLFKCERNSIKLPANCPFCDRPLQTIDAYNEHVSQHRPLFDEAIEQRAGQVKCPTCTTLVSLDSFVRHAVDESQPTDKRSLFFCPLCFKLCSQTTVYDHLRHSHSDLMPLLPLHLLQPKLSVERQRPETHPHPKPQFEQQPQEPQPTNTLNAIQTKPSTIRCPFCRTADIPPSALIRHVILACNKRAVERKGDYICHLCPASHTTPLDLWEHLQFSHSDVFDRVSEDASLQHHQCICDQKVHPTSFAEHFYNDHWLNVDVNQVFCHLCHCFFDKSQFRLHLSSVHQHELQNVHGACPFCPQKVKLVEMMNHFEVCEGVNSASRNETRKLPCPFCKKSFQWSSFVSHLDYCRIRNPLIPTQDNLLKVRLNPAPVTIVGKVIDYRKNHPITAPQLDTLTPQPKLVICPFCSQGSNTTTLIGHILTECRPTKNCFVMPFYCPFCTNKPTYTSPLRQWTHFQSDHEPVFLDGVSSVLDSATYRCRWSKICAFQGTRMELFEHYRQKQSPPVMSHTLCPHCLQFVEKDKMMKHMKDKRIYKS